MNVSRALTARQSPVLAGELGAAWVIGCQSQGVAATPKHLVGNEAETDRRHSSSMISEPALVRRVKGCAGCAD